MKPTREPRVIIRHCDQYDPARIETIIAEGLAELGLEPHGRTLVKPNLVSAGKYFPHAHTRPEFAEGVLRALQKAGGEKLRELTVGERSGITIPTRVAFKESGFDEMLGRLPGVKRSFFDEEQQLEIPLTHEGRLRDFIFVPEPVAKADFFVNLPKFKAHPWTTVTFSIKAYIGIQDDRHRLIDHDHRLNEKIADLQHVIQPRFIAIDAITAGEGRMLTPKPRDLHLVIMGNQQVAFDAVCSAILGLDPRAIDHIRLAEDHGFGTTDLSKIRITGDVTLDEAKARARGFEVGLVRVEKYFEGTNITAYAGPPPEREHSDYCWGGCPGAIEEAVEILRLIDKEFEKTMPRVHVVFGAYEGAIDAKPGEKVVFIGDCAKWEGEVGGKLVQIKSLYKERATLDPRTARHQDIYAKIASVTSKLALTRGQVIRFEGCPVSVAEQVLAIGTLGGAKNPYFEPENAVTFTTGYLAMRAQTMLDRLRGKAYQKDGPASRGEAQPEI